MVNSVFGINLVLEPPKIQFSKTLLAVVLSKFCLTYIVKKPLLPNLSNLWILKRRLVFERKRLWHSAWEQQALFGDREKTLF